MLIVGLGLLGGSYARVLKRFGFHISAITKERSSIEYAQSEGIIDAGSTELDKDLIGEADLVIFALYPHIFVRWIEENQMLLKSGAITLMTCNDKEDMEKFTGDSFRDLTRIARINDLMWSELFVANKDMLLEQMDMFMDKFKELRLMLEDENIDGMRRMMRQSTARRALFDKK